MKLNKEYQNRFFLIMKLKADQENLINLMWCLLVVFIQVKLQVLTQCKE